MSEQPSRMTMNGVDPADPRGLIREAFRIENVSEADCRSIFFDWALGMSAETDMRGAIETLLRRHADAPADHPMLRVLREGKAGAETPPRRRGGRQRRRDAAASPPDDA